MPWTPLAGRQEVVGGAVLAGSLGKGLSCSHILLVLSVEGKAVQALFAVQDTISNTGRYLFLFVFLSIPTAWNEVSAFETLFYAMREGHGISAVAYSEAQNRSRVLVFAVRKTQRTASYDWQPSIQ